MRYSLVSPPPEVFDAALLLSAAIDAHSAGDRRAASELIRKADDTVIWAYTDAAWGKGAKERYGFLTLAEEPPYFPVADRPTPRMPNSADKRRIVEWDHRHCRFCGVPLIDPAIRTLMKAAYPDVVGWPKTNVGQHAAFQCLWMQFDHLLPNSRGGRSSIDNIVLTCAPCNFGRMEMTLREAQLFNPLDEPPRVVWSSYHAWDGLERFRVVKR